LCHILAAKSLNPPEITLATIDHGDKQNGRALNQSAMK